MKENNRIKNTVSPPDQKPGADPSSQPTSPVGRDFPAGRDLRNAQRPEEPDGFVPGAHSVEPLSGRTSVPASQPTDSGPRRRRAPYRHRNHRRTGKVARLPAAIRHEICLRFTRYEEYKDIIAWLASKGHPRINESNLSRWRKGGFQDWLRNEQQKRLNLLTMTLEVLEELVKEEKRVGPVAAPRESAADPSSVGPIPSTDNGLSAVGPAKMEPRTTDSSHSTNPSIQNSTNLCQPSINPNIQSSNPSRLPPLLGGGPVSTRNN